MRSRHKKFIVVLWASFWLCFAPQLIDSIALPASASIYRQTIVGENGNSIGNLKDEAGNVWELIIWQEADDTYLRLVGYPLFQIDREQPLQFSDRNRVLFEAEDLYTQKSPAFHAAKYSVRDILSELPLERVLDLSFYLTSDRHVHLKVPPEVITQWRNSIRTKPKRDRNLGKTFLLAQNAIRPS